MNNLLGRTTLDGVVTNVLFDIGEQADTGNYHRYLQFAIRTYKELNLFSLRSPRYERAEMSEINTVELPNDFLTLISISIPVNGRMWTMTKDNKLIVPLAVVCGEEVVDEDNGEGVVLGDGHNYSGYNLGGGRNDYYFKLDEVNNRIIINGFNRSWVILAYTSTGIRVDGQSYIPKIAEEAMIAGVHDKRLRYDPKASVFDKKNAELKWEMEIEKLDFAKGPSLEDLYDAMYETFYQGVKR